MQARKQRQGNMLNGSMIGSTVVAACYIKLHTYIPTYIKLDEVGWRLQDKPVNSLHSDIAIDQHITRRSTDHENFSLRSKPAHDLTK